MRRTPPVVALVLVMASACSGSETTQRPRSTTTSEAPSTTTTTVAADLNAATVTLTKISDLTRGTAIATRPDDPALYLAQQGGQVVALENGQARPVLDLSSRVVSSGEHGLLGLTFSPDGSKLYVHFSAAGSGDTTLEEYAFSDGQVDVASRRLLLTAPDLQDNHNGGDLTFGPDGNLYLALGDGGGANDVGSGHPPEGNGQSVTTLLGKILRIDPRPTQAAQYRIPPDNPFAAGGGAPEIWVYGLHNPWRFSFDRQTGDVWIADVGQGTWEEVNVVVFDAAAGSNFGWPLQEGAHDLRGGAAPGSTVLPIHETSHANGNCAITGGYVYRGTRIPNLVGSYLYSDYCRPAIAAIQVRDGRIVVARDLGVSAGMVAAFGQDNEGELYVVSQSEGVYRIDPA